MVSMGLFIYIAIYIYGTYTYKVHMHMHACMASMGLFISDARAANVAASFTRLSSKVATRSAPCHVCICICPYTSTKYMYMHMYMVEQQGGDSIGALPDKDHTGPRAGEHEEHTGPKAGEHEGHMGPKAGERSLQIDEGHTGPKAGERSLAGGFYQRLAPSPRLLAPPSPTPP